MTVPDSIPMNKYFSDHRDASYIPRINNLCGCVEVHFITRYWDTLGLNKWPLATEILCTQGTSPIDKSLKYTELKEAAFGQEAAKKIARLAYQWLDDAKKIEAIPAIGSSWRRVPFEHSSQVHPFS